MGMTYEGHLTSSLQVKMTLTLEYLKKEKRDVC